MSLVMGWQPSFAPLLTAGMMRVHARTWHFEQHITVPATRKQFSQETLNPLLAAACQVLFHAAQHVP